MVLVKCLYCDKLVSESARQCVHCDTSNPTNKEIKRNKDKWNSHIKCRECGNNMIVRKIYFYNNMCPHCGYEGNYIPCEVCGKPSKKDEKYTFDFNCLKEVKFFCENCMPTCCMRCHKEFKRSELIIYNNYYKWQKLSDKYYCKQCYPRFVAEKKSK